ncbi:MAG: alpha/beta fold hydrolase, partial [Singulisphaera sp.]
MLIHGFGGLINTWDRNIAELAEGGYQVYALELKGFGLTAKPKDAQYHLAAFERHLLGFLDAMGLESPILIGHSMGGAVATRLALLHPARVGGLILVDPAPLEFPYGVDGPGGRTGRPPGDEAGSSSASPHQALAHHIYLKRSFHNTELVTDEKAELVHRTMRLDGAVEALIALLDSPPEPPGTLPPLASLKVPTLVIWGRYDRVLRADSVDAYVRGISGARKIIFCNSGHQPHEEEPEKFNRRVLRFMNRACHRPDRCDISADRRPDRWSRPDPVAIGGPSGHQPVAPRRPLEGASRDAARAPRNHRSPSAVGLRPSESLPREGTRALPAGFSEAWLGRPRDSSGPDRGGPRPPAVRPGGRRRRTDAHGVARPPGPRDPGPQ